VHLATFLHQDADETTDQHGGFFLQFAFRNEFCHMNFTTDTARYNVAFEWQLTSDGGFVRDMLATPPRRLDGRPVPVPVFKDGNTGGHDSVDLHFAFDAALSGSREGGSSLPRSIYETVDKLLVYAGAACLPGKNCYPCTPQGPALGGSPPIYPQHDPTVPVVPAADYDGTNGQPSGTEMCNSKDSPFLYDLYQSFRSAAMPLSSEERAEVIEEVFGSLDGVSYDRIRCNSYHDQSTDADVSRCEYVIPAKRVVVTPDQLELVFLDNDTEIGNPAYPIYLIA
jgi:hypothetical protein